jgi:hypothetical protein
MKSVDPTHRFLCRFWGVLFAVILAAGFIRNPASAQSGRQPARVQISFLAKTLSTLPVKGEVVLRPAEPNKEPVRLAVTSPADLSLALPPGSKWEVSAEIPGFWVAHKDLTVGSPDQPSHVTLDLWPLGSVSGVVKFKEKGIPLPKKILVKTLAVPSFLKRPVTPKGAVDCPVDPKGAWSCSLPATTYDLVISAEGSTPAYRWGAQVPAGKTVSLGTVELARGASVAGWVAVEEGRIEPQRCIARLDLAVAGGGNLQSISQLQRTSVEREVAKDGFFQFSGLAPGTYVLEVRQPGYPAVRSQPIRVDPGAETLLREPLILQRPLAFQMEIRPPLDWLGRPWHAQVFKLGERPPLPIVFDGRADEEGRFAVSGQSAGRFRVSVQDSLGNKLYSREHALDAGSGPQPIEVHFVTVEGKIRLGIEPLASTLWFDGRSGANAVRMEADNEGKFHGVLPREGVWRIEVQATLPGFPTWTRADVQASRSGKAKLDVALPDTRVFGRVVNEQGKPVPGADVSLQGGGLYTLEEADSAGNFEARGLPEGPVWLGAEASSQVSDLVLATLAEGNTAGPIELHLHPTRKLTGTVTSPRGPVAGSRVMIQARAPGGGGGTAVTDTDGAFQVNLSPTASRLVAVAGAPGFALRAFDAQADKPLLLPLSEDQGRLEVTLPLTSEELLRADLFLAIFQNGLPIPSSALGQWLRDHGQALDDATRTLRVPEVAPGEYRVCLLSRQLEQLVLWSSAPGGSGCASGLLAPGATLSLKPSRPG